MKKAFTMMELVMVLITSTVLTSYGWQTWKNEQWYSSVNEMNENIAKILDKAVMDTTTGYINASGGDCSSSFEYTDISAARAIDCIDWSQTFPYDGTKSTNGTESYIKGFLKTYSSSLDGCKLYIDDKSTNEYYIYLDCSNLSYGNDAQKKFVEQKLSSYLKSNFSTIYQSTDFSSTGITNNSGGNDKDGKVRLLFKK